MAYADNISEKEKIIIPSKNGLFVTPEGGGSNKDEHFM